MITSTLPPTVIPPPAATEGTDTTPETMHLSYDSIAAFDAIIDSLADALDKDF